MSTQDHLQEAFAGESQANRKYLAFAEKADKDGFPQVARLFRAAAQAETVHAHAHLRVMGGINDTAQNLQEAAEGEQHEFTSMYPGFVETAKKEENKAALRSFENAMAVEKIHHDLYLQAIESVKAGQDLAEKRVFVCAVCGNTVHDEAPDKCPICGVPKEKFFEVQ